MVQLLLLLTYFFNISKLAFLIKKNQSDALILEFSVFCYPHHYKTFATATSNAIGGHLGKGKNVQVGTSIIYSILYLGEWSMRSSKPWVAL
jgi:hypothetical protein